MSPRPFFSRLSARLLAFGRATLTASIHRLKFPAFALADPGWAAIRAASASEGQACDALFALPTDGICR